MGDGLTALGLTDAEFRPDGSRVVLASAGESIYRSEDAGASWELVSRVQAKVTDLTFPGPGTDKVIAATTDGLFLSSDGGNTWSQEGLSGLGLSFAVSHSAQPETLFAAAGSAGIFHSHDGGRRWGGSRDDQGEVLVFTVTPDHGDPKHAVSAGTFLTTEGARLREGALFETMDGGTTWRTVFLGEDAHDVIQCEYDRSVWIAGMGREVLRSSDNGQTWVKTAELQDFVNGATFLGSCSELLVHTQRGGVFRSTDGGQSFDPTFSEELSFPSLFRFAVHHGGDTVLAFDRNGAGAFRSTDRGQTWSPVAEVGDISLRSLQVVGNELYLGTWGSGAWKIQYGSPTWTRLDHEPKFTFFVDVIPNSGGVPLVGGWPQLFRGDSAGELVPVNSQSLNPWSVAFDPEDSAHIYVASQARGVLESKDGGNTWKIISTNLPLVPVEKHITSIGYDAAGSLHVSTNEAGTFRLESDGLWVSYGGELPVGISSTLEFEGPILHLRVGDLGVARLRDGTWELYNDGLTDLVVRDIAYDPASYGYLAATAQGVFWDHDSWTEVFDDCALPGQISKIALVSGNPSVLLLGTTSDGVFERTLELP